MSRPTPRTIWLVLAIAALIFACLPLLKGGLFVDRHESDHLHVLLILNRLDLGQIPHLDFQTPIGVLAFLPIDFFFSAGLGAGMSFVLAQALVVAILFPLIGYVAVTRFQGWVSVGFGVVLIVLATALVHGGSASVITFSMYYNRWAWAIAFLALALVLLPSNGQSRPRVDGVLLGVCAAALLLIKVTYFVALMPAVLVALLSRRAFGTLAMAFIAGSAAAILTTLLYGFGFWGGYVSDLVAVATSPTRSAPGDSFGDIVAQPAFLGGTLISLALVVAARRAGLSSLGLAVLLLIPGLAYITYQNFGNDPQSLVFVGFLALAVAPTLKPGVGLALATAAFALSFPSYSNMAYSHLRHLGIDTSEFSPLVSGNERYSDLQAASIRVDRFVGAERVFETDIGIEPEMDTDDLGADTVFQGQTLPRCRHESGEAAVNRHLVSEMSRLGVPGGARVFYAGVVPGFRLYGDFPPLKGGSPWWYLGLPGFDDAEYIVIPSCPLWPAVRRVILDEISATDVALETVGQTPSFWLLRKR